MLTHLLNANNKLKNKYNKIIFIIEYNLNIKF